MKEDTKVGKSILITWLSELSLKGAKTVALRALLQLNE